MVPFPSASLTSEVLSRGVPVGAIEVPSREELLVLHRGRGVTAGYPVLAVVTSRSLDLLAQARPGHTVTFRKTTVAEATAMHRTACLELDNSGTPSTQSSVSSGSAPASAGTNSAQRQEPEHHECFSHRQGLRPRTATRSLTPPNPGL